jgi:hypothetical protein
VIASAALLLVSLPAAACLPQDAAAPAASSSAGASPSAAVAPGERRSPSSDEIRRSRSERLAREKKALEAELQKIDAFDRVGPFREALVALSNANVDFATSSERWVRVSKGWLPMMAIEHWLQWHPPGPGGKPPIALDLKMRNHPFPAIVDFAEQLHEHDIEFLLAVFPSRLQIYPELVLPDLGELPPDRFRGMVGATTRFLLALDERGVETVNLAPVFVDARRVQREDDANPELFLTRNKHWTPRAAELAARVVADRLREMPWYVQGPSAEGADFEILRSVRNFTGTAGGQAPDLTPERIEIVQVRDVGKGVRPDEQRRSPIVVLGDSFAKYFSEEGTSSSFLDHLRRFTGHPIDRITPMGGAELQCRAVLAQRGDGLRGKKVVVWLVHEDNLRPATGFRNLDVFER